MTDEKKIEEMAKCMCSSYETGKGCKTCPTNWCYADECATMAFCNGYRKIPKGSVVIPEKITEETSPEDIIKIAKYNEKVRKETAKEICLKIIEGLPRPIQEKCVEWFKKQYGVEVEYV